MKILLNRSRARQLQRLLTTKNSVLCALLYLSGVIGIFLLADLRVNQNTFVSENALLPGYVVSKYQQQNIAASLNREFQALGSRDAQQVWITHQFRELGLEVYTHNFTVSRPLSRDQISGSNIYAVYRAPKVASTESIVFSTTLKEVQYAVPLMVSLCHLITKQTIWAKDVIFLVSEEEEFGIGAWLQAYHDVNTLPYITSSPILTHSGAIQAALHLDMPVQTFDRLRMFVEAINGQLPDIDLVVLVRQICRQERIQLLLRNGPHDIGDYLGNLLGLHANMAWQAAGRVSSPNALYHPYNIHAVGVRTERSASRAHLSWQHIGRFTESVLRSVNNLEEQFHTAYYFYLMPCIERFVCLSVYMIPCGLLAGAVAVRILGLWFTCGKPSQVQGSEIFFSNIDVNTIDCVHPFLHGIIFGCLNEVVTSCLLDSGNIVYVLCASQLIVIVSAVFTKEREDWRLHQAFVLLLHLFTLVVLSMLNISLTIFYAIPSSAVFMLQFPSKGPVRILQRLLMLIVNPLVLVVLYSYLYVFLHLENSQDSVLHSILHHSTSLVESKYTLGVWTWTSYCFLLLPVWALHWTLRLPSACGVSSADSGVSSADYSFKDTDSSVVGEKNPVANETGAGVVGEKDKTE